MSEVEQVYEVFSYPKKKHPKVVRRKLGKHKAHAQFTLPGLIEIDVRYKGKKELILYLHEYYHFLFPDWSEDEVIKCSEMTADFLWKNSYRKIDNVE